MTTSPTEYPLEPERSSDLAEDLDAPPSRSFGRRQALLGLGAAAVAVTAVACEPGGGTTTTTTAPAVP
ncbi:MAG: hypothetical protein FGM58_00120, partial [Acidimicrobiia bacterium]|nr:hypothetical protein [Acidimicrobiia bacterium]